MRMILLTMVLLPGLASAQTLGDGQLAVRLSQELLCDTYSLLSGNIGLMIGFLVAVWGLYRLIKGDMKGGVILIVVGALFTAVPGIVMSFFDGMGLSLGGITEVHSIQRPQCLGK